MRYQIRHAVVQYAADVILEDVNFEIRDTEKIAVIGRNGCGKTTLLKLIAGDIQMSNPDSDEECGITMAGDQKIGYLRQISFEDGNISVEEEILKVFEPIFACEKKNEAIAGRDAVKRRKSPFTEICIPSGTNGGAWRIYLP